jgi:prephenate dehydrogenase
MHPDDPPIAILGAGLIGGSLALALRDAGAAQVSLWDCDPFALDAARALGIDRVCHTLRDAVADARLLVLAVPIGAMPGLLSQAMDAGLADACLVTDVGSVKAAPHRDLAPLLAPRAMRFLGSHPMAGSERSGTAAASAGLFHGAACLLTSEGDADPSDRSLLEHLWQRVGCHTHWTTVCEHDAVVAKISHLPHAVASALARVALEDPSLGRFGAGGLRDSTRVAAGNPSMWSEILIENRAALMPWIAATAEELRLLEGLLRSGDRGALQRWLDEAKHRRDRMADT